MSKVLGKIVGGFLLAIVLLVILLVGYCSYQSNTQETQGREWCDKVIRAYINDPQQTLDSYPNLPSGDGYVLLPAEDFSGLRPMFSVDNEGNFKCSYSHAGGLFPIFHEYSSQTGKWERFD